MATFQATVRRKIENHCPEYKDYDPKKYAAKFRKISRGTFRLIGKNDPAALPGRLSGSQAEIRIGSRKIHPGHLRSKKGTSEKSPEAPRDHPGHY
ncbi:hypothetical protein I6G79_10075 [Burkholderia plantarii]|nr:hypothetical protein [Burkholderia plantarii]